MQAVRDSAIPADDIQAILDALGLMRDVAPEVPFEAAGFDFDADALHEAAGLPGGAEMAGLTVALSNGSPAGLAAAAALPDRISPERVAALGRAGGMAPERLFSPPRAHFPKSPTTMTKRGSAQTPLQDAQARAAALGIPLKTRGGTGKTYYGLKHLETKIAEATARNAAAGAAEEDMFGGIFTGMGIKGRGISLPLGRYHVNSRKLHDNIVQIRSARGGAVKQFPSERVSAAVGSCLRKIIGGKALSFDEIDGLSDPERRYLHRVTTQCDCDAGIPAPKKDEETVEADNFALWKGEIQAGNDNPEMVRKFKALILNMAGSGRLPRQQVHQTLIDLLALGK